MAVQNMGRVETAWLFSKWALEFMFATPLWIVLALAAASIIWAAFQERPFQTGLWKPSHCLVLSQLLFFPAAIVLGVLWPSATIGPAFLRHTNQFAFLCLNGLLYVSLALCGFWTWWMKGFRWFGGSLMALIELPTLGAIFIAGMSITGDWL